MTKKISKKNPLNFKNTKPSGLSKTGNGKAEVVENFSQFLQVFRRENASFISKSVNKCKMAKYYLDTSIWLDLFESRNEPHLPKADYAEAFIEGVISKGETLIYSNAVKVELEGQDYAWWEIDRFFEPLTKVLEYVEYTVKQFTKAKDLAAKRNLPLMDALHAILARDCKAMLISRDTDFSELKDIVKTEKPEDVN
mgnify:CR=1 FL=1